MRLDLYQAETERIANEQTAILDEARAILLSARSLSALENNGVLHALQMLIENAIGKVKQWLKAKDQPVPISVYDAFSAPVTIHLLDVADLPHWNALIGILQVTSNHLRTLARIMINKTYNGMPQKKFDRKILVIGLPILAECPARPYS